MQRSKKMEEKKTVYLTVHKNFVREDISYADKKTGEQKTFNSVTLPKGTVIDGQDVSYYQFSPMFVNPARFKGENFRDIPLKANSEVWLHKSVLDTDGNPVISEEGKQLRDTVKVMPQALREAVERGRNEYFSSLSEKAKDAKEASQAIESKSERAPECAER